MKKIISLRSWDKDGYEEEKIVISPEFDNSDLKSFLSEEAQKELSKLEEFQGVFGMTEKRGMFSPKGEEFFLSSIAGKVVAKVIPWDKVSLR